MSYKKIIIVGAPRSGTNMLRDVLCELNGIGTWPCDEINYIWRHGNIKKNTDEFDSELARPEVKKFIRHEFDDFAKKQKLDVLVEKTCASSLRVPFIDEIFPEAKYVFIYRDGVDVVGSALKRWKAALDIPYLLRKVRYVPLVDLPYYATRYFLNRLYRLFSKEERLAFWGPQFKGLEVALEQHTLEKVCALQWKRCVDLSEDAFAKMSFGKVVRVSYEDFVSAPESELGRILNELELPFDKKMVNEATRNVSNTSIGKGRKALDQEQTCGIVELISSSLNRYGHE